MGRIKHLVTNFLIKHLLKTVTIDDLFRKEGRDWYIGRHKLDAEELEALKEEADNLLTSEIWRLLSQEILWQSNLSMFEKAKTDSDMLFGKAMLYITELQRKFLETVRDLK
jgi:hypothetical protein